MPLDPADWARSENDTAAGFVVEGDDAAARGLYGEARKQWRRAQSVADDELAAAARRRLQSLSVDPIFWVAAVAIVLTNVWLLVRFLGQ